MIVDNEWIEPSEVRKLFETTVEVEIDEELGLPIVKKETIEQKYGLPPLDPRNDFHNSLKEQFEQRGRLSDKQVYCLRNPRY